MFSFFFPPIYSIYYTIYYIINYAKSFKCIDLNSKQEKGKYEVYYYDDCCSGKMPGEKENAEKCFLRRTFLCYELMFAR